MFGYMSHFHLKYRVFFNNLPGHTGPQEWAPSFVVSLDGVLPVEKQIEDGMRGMATPVRPPGLPAAGKSRHTESQRESLKAGSNLHIGVTLANKPVVPRPTEVPTNFLKESVKPSEVVSQMGATGSGIDQGEVGGVTKQKEILDFSLDLPTNPNPPDTGEEETILKPLTNTNNTKDISKEVLEVVNDDKK